MYTIYKYRDLLNIPELCDIVGISKEEKLELFNLLGLSNSFCSPTKEEISPTYIKEEDKNSPPPLTEFLETIKSKKVIDIRFDEEGKMEIEINEHEYHRLLWRYPKWIRKILYELPNILRSHIKGVPDREFGLRLERSNSYKVSKEIGDKFIFSNVGENIWDPITIFSVCLNKVYKSNKDLLLENVREKSAQCVDSAQEIVKQIGIKENLLGVVEDSMSAGRSPHDEFTLDELFIEVKDTLGMFSLQEEIELRGNILEEFNTTFSKIGTQGGELKELKDREGGREQIQIIDSQLSRLENIISTYKRLQNLLNEANSNSSAKESSKNMNTSKYIKHLIEEEGETERRETEELANLHAQFEELKAEDSDSTTNYINGLPRSKSEFIASCFPSNTPPLFPHYLILDLIKWSIKHHSITGKLYIYIYI